MRRRYMMTAAVLGVPLLAVALARAGDPKVNPLDKDGSDAVCGKHGTTVVFEDSPTDAAKKAKKEEKLVMVLHVSGIFEDPKLT
jgi:hypothetical protein